jgi:ubiquinone/menaquinone biosynthesis C-methylase UbiE
MIKPEEYGFLHKGEHIKSASLNKQLWDAKGMDADKILFMDVDMKFPIHTLPQLISNNVPIVGGLYYIRGHPYSPVGGWTNSEGTNINGNGKMWKEDYCPLPPDQLVEVDWTGVGCLLVDMDVFDKIKYPCFYDEWEHDAGVRKRGHDVIFCEAVRKAGYKVYVDTKVSCGHRVVDYVDRAWVETYYESNFGSVYTRKIKAISSESAWWEEEWYEKWYKKLEKRPYVYWNWVKNMVPEGVTVADLGCGDGGLLRMLKENNNNKCHGYDFANASIDCLETKGLTGTKIDLRVYEPNPNEKYNTVILSHVLEHIDDEHLYRVLKTAAEMTEDQAFIVVPKEPQLWVEHKRLYTEDLLLSQVSKFFDDVELHFVEYTPVPGEGPKVEDLNKRLEKEYQHIVAHCKSPKI